MEPREAWYSRAMPDGQVSPALDVAHCRSHFPALSSPLYPGLALLDNAGGSVTPSQVSERAQRYMAEHMVQLGASYPLSASAQERVSEGVQAAATLVGAMPSEVVIGPSTTMNVLVLSLALRPLWRAGDEVVVSELDHEANIGAFRHLEQTEIRVRTWPMHRETASLRLEELLPLLNPRTRLVAFTHCSNIVGRIHDVAGITSAVHDAGADVCVDGVAYAPHRLLDLHALGVDYYLLSLYKVFGPHLGLLFGKRDKLLLARGVNHYFIEEDAIPYKLQPGNVNHELKRAAESRRCWLVTWSKDACTRFGTTSTLATRTWATCSTISAWPRER
jgi:selenocysteine lyase/cysteine desulfurase